MKEKKLQNWLDLNKDRNDYGICESCFKKTLKLILSKKEQIKIKSGNKKQEI